MLLPDVVSLSFQPNAGAISSINNHSSGYISKLLTILIAIWFGQVVIGTLFALHDIWPQTLGEVSHAQESCRDGDEQQYNCDDCKGR